MRCPSAPLTRRRRRPLPPSAADPTPDTASSRLGPLPHASARELRHSMHCRLRSGWCNSPQRAPNLAHAHYNHLHNFCATVGGPQQQCTRPGSSIREREAKFAHVHSERAREPRELQPGSNAGRMEDRLPPPALSACIDDKEAECRALAEEGRARLTSLTTTSQAAIAEAEAKVLEQQRLLDESVQPDSTADCAQVALQLRDAKLQLKKAEGAASECHTAAAKVAAIDNEVRAIMRGRAGPALLLGRLDDAPQTAITRSALLDGGYRQLQYGRSGRAGRLRRMLRCGPPHSASRR